jgi:hypothetical protein
MCVSLRPRRRRFSGRSASRPTAWALIFFGAQLYLIAVEDVVGIEADVRTAEIHQRPAAGRRRFRGAFPSWASPVALRLIPGLFRVHLPRRSVEADADRNHVFGDLLAQAHAGIVLLSGNVDQAALGIDLDLHIRILRENLGELSRDIRQLPA